MPKQELCPSSVEQFGLNIHILIFLITPLPNTAHGKNGTYTQTGTINILDSLSASFSKWLQALQQTGRRTTRWEQMYSLGSRNSVRWTCFHYWLFHRFPSLAPEEKYFAVLVYGMSSFSANFQECDLTTHFCSKVTPKCAFPGMFMASSEDQSSAGSLHADRHYPASKSLLRHLIKSSFSHIFPASKIRMLQLKDKEEMWKIFVTRCYPSLHLIICKIKKEYHHKLKIHQPSEGGLKVSIAQATVTLFFLWDVHFAH